MLVLSPYFSHFFLCFYLSSFYFSFSSPFLFKSLIFPCVPSHFFTHFILPFLHYDPYQLTSGYYLPKPFNKSGTLKSSFKNTKIILPKYCFFFSFKLSFYQHFTFLNAYKQQKKYLLFTMTWLLFYFQNYLVLQKFLEKQIFSFLTYKISRFEKNVFLIVVSKFYHT